MLVCKFYCIFIVISKSFNPFVPQVIVKDVVSKSVITQFKAHKSPIAALCFDPSGTLLVTASVQGHNINVFCIMPGHPASDASGSCFHLYRLQRGLTNAVRLLFFHCSLVPLAKML